MLSLDQISANNANNLFSATTTSQSQLDTIANSSLSRGIDAYTSGNLAQAVTDFKRAIGLSPYSDNSLKAFQMMADAYQRLGKPDEAIKAYQQAARLFPQSDIPHTKLGDIYYGQKNYKAAEGEYTMAVRLNPTLSSNVYSLGQAYLAEGNYSAAETQFKKVTQLSPNDPSGYYALGQDYHKMGRYDDAATQLNKAVQINGKFADAHLELGKTYADLKQTDKANEQADILSRIDQTQSTQLQDYIFKISAPKLVAAFNTSGFNASLGPGTALSTMDSSLSSPDSSHMYTMNFIFNKDMDPQSVQNISNWLISKSSGSETGGASNWGLAVQPTETNISPLPISVIYNPDTLTASVSFKITQNAAGDGTLDPSHIMFKFSGIDTYKNSMDLSADQYSGISQIV
jgi:tetratricopeptide (TPR) repeat protein